MNNSFNLNDVSGVDRAKSHANLSSRIKEKFFLFNTVSKKYYKGRNYDR